MLEGQQGIGGIQITKQEKQHIFLLKLPCYGHVRTW